MSTTKTSAPASYTQDELYKLLPAVYREKDEALGGPLAALFGVIAQQVGVLEQDLKELHDNWFIETCDPWVVPYIGDLVGARLLNPISQGLDQTKITGSQNHRAYVADTIGYRRRKGTLSMLEQLAHDITSWNANCVEYFQLLGWTQFVNHLRPQILSAPDPLQPECFRTPDLRDEDTLELLDSPFDRVSHTVEVRHISDRSGRYNIPNIGVFLWRLRAMPVVYAPAHKVESNGDCFTFSTLGLDTPLFNDPAETTAEFELVKEVNVPHPIRRRDMFEHLQTYYANTGQNNSVTLFGGGASLACDGQVIPGIVTYTVDEIVVCDLTDWEHTPSSGKVAVDPVLGRIKFAPGEGPPNLRASWYYGFGGEVGGGFYPRSDACLSATLPTQPTVYQISKFPQQPNCPTKIYSGIKDALTNGWTSDGKPSAILQIMDSEVYSEAIQQISVPPGVTLEIRGSQTPTPQRPVLVLTQSPAPPSPPPLVQALVVSGQLPTPSERQRGSFILNGVVLSNTRVEVAPGDLGCLTIRHSTLIPNGDVSVIVDAGTGGSDSNDNLVVSLERAITGGVYCDMTASEATLSVCDSIIDKKRSLSWSNITTPGSQDSSDLADFLIQTLDVGWIEGQPFLQNTTPTHLHEVDISGTDISGRGHTLSLTATSSVSVTVAIDGGQPWTMAATNIGTTGSPNLVLLYGAAINFFRTTIKNSTVFGRVETALMDLGSNTIFTDTVKVRRVQSGCVRYSYFPADSRVPRPYKCQPIASYPQGATDSVKASLGLQLKPRFTSETYGDPGYAELRQDGPTKIFEGADNGAEMGVFNYLLAALRVENLNTALEEYLRFGLEAGVFLAS